VGSIMFVIGEFLSRTSGGGMNTTMATAGETESRRS
jgi:hypothetical protein